MTAPPTRVLFIDDSPTQLRAAAAALTKSGCEVHSALNIAEAERSLANVDVVLVDYNMPGISGVETLRVLKSKLAPNAVAPKFYLYTTDPSAAKSYRDMGFDGLFVLKGDISALVKQMDSVVRLLKLQSLRPAV